MSGAETGQSKAADPAFPHRLSYDALNCPACGGQVKVHAVGHAVSVVCGHCGSVIDTADTFAVIGKVKMAADWTPCFEIGKDVRVDEKKWRCVGAARRTLEDGSYSWEEYLIHNPFLGFRWIVLNGGWFYFGKRVNSLPRGFFNQEGDHGSTPASLSVSGHDFLRYDTCRARYSFLVGEFYWQVREGDAVAMSDYVLQRPRSAMLSAERDGMELNLTLLRWLPREEIQAHLNPRRVLALPSEESPLLTGETAQGAPEISMPFAIGCTVAAVVVGFALSNVHATANVAVYAAWLWWGFLSRRSRRSSLLESVAFARTFLAKVK